MILYKLTDANDRTRGGTQWGPGVCIRTNGKGELCGRGWTHWYTHPLLAVLFNPTHADIDLREAHLWEGDSGEGETRSDHGLKVGCTTGQTVRRVELPVVTTEQAIRFSVGCALQVYRADDFVGWAARWLDGSDTSAGGAARWLDGSDTSAGGAAWSAEAWSEAWSARAVAAEAAEGAAWSAGIDLIALATWAVSGAPAPAEWLSPNYIAPEVAP